MFSPWGRGSGLLLPVKAVDGFDKAEDRKGDDEEVQNGGEEGAVMDGNGGAHLTAAGVIHRLPQHPLPLGEVRAAGEQGEQGHQDVVDQGGGNFAEGAADDDAHRHVQHIPSGNELAELRQEAGGLFGKFSHGALLCKMNGRLCTYVEAIGAQGFQRFDPNGAAGGAPNDPEQSCAPLQRLEMGSTICIN